MSRENVEVVRQRVAVASHSRRRLEEHLVRFPRVVLLWARAIWWVFLRLPARSRLRKAVARRYAQLEFEACNRQDWDVAFALYHPAAETIWDPSMVAVGFDSLTRGRDERISAQKRWAAEWGEFRFEPEELLDLRDGRFLVVGQVTGTGLSSGAASANAWAVLLTLSAGLAVREQVFLDRREALQAVGLAE